MTIHIDGRQTDTGSDTAATRVLLLVEHRDTRSALADWLQAQAGYDPAPGQGIADTEFDICVFDRPGFEKHEEQLRRASQQGGPVARPHLLVLPESESALDWNDIDSTFDGIVDDVLRRPLDDVDARATLDRNRRLRREREAHERTSDRLAKFERTVDAMEHALYVTDTDGTITFVNPAFTEMTGFEPAEAIGETPAILKSDYHDDEYYEQLWNTITAGDVWNKSVVNERKNGERYHADQTIVPVTDGSGTIESYVAVQTDITKRWNREKQLEVLDRILRHNLRNDLNVIHARATMLEEKARDDLQPHAIAILSKSRELIRTANKEREIVQLLTGPRCQREQHISAVARNAVDRVGQTYPDAELTTDIQDDVHWAASPKLNRAIEELLVNAIVHNDTEQPTVKLSVDTYPNRVEVMVADDGPGIPGSETAILEAPDSLDPLFHGSGLGLWLVYWIAKRSQGTVTFAENEPRGSVVTLRITDSDTGPERLLPSDL
jgi:PAS domain S-box-containing protein